MFTKKKIKNRSQQSQRRTVDTAHSSKLKSLNALPKKEAQLLKQKTELENELAELKQIPKREMSDEQIDRLFDLKTECEKIDEEITKNSQSKNDYFLETGHLLFNYYGKKNGRGNTGAPRKKRKNNMQSANSSKSVLDFFQKKEEPTNSPNQSPETIDTTKEKNMGEIIDEYMGVIDESFSKPILNNFTEFCQKCRQHKIYIETESIIICTNCGEQEQVLMNHNKPSYKDVAREYTFFAYKRINHFNEWLSQFQAKESTHIPPKIIEDLRAEIQKERITEKDINTSKIRRYLKKLGYNKYYEHIPHIINKLNGVPPPIITSETEEQLRSMFKMIQVPFIKHCPPKRKNFLSYAYVLHKFVEMLGMHDLTSCFPLLKSRQKLYQQDTIWKNICKELEWPFIKSV